MHLNHIAHPKPKHKGTQQLFAHPWLERLTRTHIGVPVTIFLVYGAVLLGYCTLRTPLGLGQAGALFAGGLLLFTFVEYWVHRSVYHVQPRSARMARFQYRIHGVHHEYPKDKDRLAMPPWLSLAIATLLLWGFERLWGHAGLAVLSGFLTGYALYLLVHYSTHAFAPPKNRLKILWEHHAMHHYKDPGKAFGVSSPLWDYVFGTQIKRSKPSLATRPLRQTTLPGEPAAL